LDRLPPLDLLLISHNHYDHLDAPTLRPLARDTPVVVPCGLGRWFRRRGFTSVTELDWWQSVRVGALEVTFVPAHHWSRRGLFDHCATLWGGLVLTLPGGTRVYHAGDSAYGPFFASIGARYPGIDVAMLPIGAYSPRWFMGNMHVDPEEAVQAGCDVGARVMVPMHWGTFRLSREPALEPIERIRAAWAAAGRDPADTCGTLRWGRRAHCEHSAIADFGSSVVFGRHLHIASQVRARFLPARADTRAVIEDVFVVVF
jgi:L-ascorbate metabolism protein UlaG (beta-lactamase superfamily)